MVLIGFLIFLNGKNDKTFTFLNVMTSSGLPHCQAQVEDGQGHRWREDGGPSLPQVQRDGPVQLPATAAARVRQLLDECCEHELAGMHTVQACCCIARSSSSCSQIGGALVMKSSELRP